MMKRDLHAYPRLEALAAIIAEQFTLEREGARSETHSEVVPTAWTYRIGDSTPQPDWRLDFQWRWKHATGESVFSLHFEREELRTLRNALDLWLKAADADLEMI